MTFEMKVLEIKLMVTLKLELGKTDSVLGFVLVDVVMAEKCSRAIEHPNSPDSWTTASQSAHCNIVAIYCGALSVQCISTTP